MPRVRFTRHLERFFPDLPREERIEGSTVRDVVRGLDRRHPGLADYIVDERGSLRQHVNIFLGDAQIVDRSSLGDPVGDDDVLFILQALSGG